MFRVSKNRRKQRGMTLIEILVVITVIGVITGVAWANFRHLGKAFDIERDINRIAQEVRTSLQTAMAMKDFEIGDIEGCTTTVGTIPVVISYGANFRTNQGFYDKMVYVINNSSTHPNFGKIICSKELETIDFEQGSISSIKTLSGSATSSASVVDIIFTPPHPRTYIGSIEIETGTGRWKSKYDKVEITILSSETGDQRTLRVNSAGMIEIIQP